MPSEAPTSSFPTSAPNDGLLLNSFSEPPVYTKLPTPSPTAPSASGLATENVQLDIRDEDSSEFSGFLITTQKETACSKVVDSSGICKLDCVVTIKLYHDNVLIHKPTLVKYETVCLDDNTVSTRFLETST